MKRIFAVVCLLAFVLSGCGLLSKEKQEEKPLATLKPVTPTEQEQSPVTEQVQVTEEAETTSPTEATITYTTYYVVNCEESIPLYAEADVSSAQVGTLPLGASVSFIKTAENGFCNVVYQGITGYAFAANLSETAPETSTEKYVTYYVVNCHEYISLRSVASSAATVLARIPLGASVSYISTAENGFYKVIYNGQTGYALSSYLSQDPNAHSTPENNTSDEIFATCYVVNCKQSITLRTSPSTGASEICQIPLGAAVSYVETASNGFYKVIYLGNTGYALASYLSFTRPSGYTYNSEYLRVVNCNEYISLRKAPSVSADTYCHIPLGDYVEYLGPAENGFLLVAYDGYIGYALASYLN